MFSVGVMPKASKKSFPTRENVENSSYTRPSASSGRYRMVEVKQPLVATEPPTLRRSDQGAPSVPSTPSKSKIMPDIKSTRTGTRYLRLEFGPLSGGGRDDGAKIGKTDCTTSSNVDPEFSSDGDKAIIPEVRGLTYAVEDDSLLVDEFDMEIRTDDEDSDVQILEVQPRRE